MKVFRTYNQQQNQQQNQVNNNQAQQRVHTYKTGSKQMP